MGEYDSENIFAKILDKKETCFKVFESETSLAFLDAFPAVEGHTIVIPKLKGHTDLVSMPPAKSAAFLADVQRVARAVKTATDATGITLWQDNGADAGQTVLHPHFHVIPRKAGDNLITQPASAKDKIEVAAAGPVMEKIEAALNPPKSLKKATFGKVTSISPDSAGLNLKLKVVGDATLVETKAGKFWEVLCGDPSGTVVVSLREHQKDVATKGAMIALRNAATRMVTNHVRLAVDKWGKIEACDEEMEGEVEMKPEKNVSATEYEMVAGGK
jgi:histidine triad (HIT) family protein